MILVYLAAIYGTIGFACTLILLAWVLIELRAEHGTP
jgi:hypothetical protein